VNGFLNPDSGKLVKPAPGTTFVIIFYYLIFKITYIYLKCLLIIFEFCLIIGLCIKLLKTDKSKVFINLCHHADIPPPDDITKEELVEVFNSKDPEKFCIPLSIGVEHQETDKCKSKHFYTYN